MATYVKNWPRAIVWSVVIVLAITAVLAAILKLVLLVF